MQFLNIPVTLKTPGSYVEVREQSGRVAEQPRVVLVGQIGSEGTATVGLAVRCFGVADAEEKCAPNSMLADMARAWFANNALAEVWLYPVADPAGGTAAGANVALTGTATEAGTLSVYLGAQLVTVSVAKGATGAQLAALLETAVNANTRLLAVAETTDTDCALTFAHLGTLGNKYDLRLNLLGEGAGERTPAGITVEITQFADGAGAVTLSGLAAALDNLDCRWIVHPYATTTPLDAVKAELDARWLYDRQQYGHAFSAFGGSLAECVSAAAARDNKRETLFTYRDAATLGEGTTDPRGEGVRIGHGDAPWTWVAAHAGAHCAAVGQRASRASVGLPVVGVKGCHIRDQWRKLADTEALLAAGASYSRVDAAGRVRTGDVVTTGRTNAAGAPTQQWYPANVPEILGAFVLQIPRWLAADFENYNVADNGARVSGNVNVVTPAIAAAKAIEYYAQGEADGLVDDTDAFSKSLRVVRDSDNPDRLNFQILPDLANTFKIGAWVIEFTR